MSNDNIKKEDVKQEVFDLYDDYAHSRINRRDFMEKLSAYAVGSITVPALMSFLMPDYKNSLQVSADDPRLKSEYINYKSEKGGGTIKGGRILDYMDKGDENRKACSLHLTLMDRMGVKLDRFGDATTRLTEL